MDIACYITPAEVQRSLGIVCTGYGFSSLKKNSCPPRDLGCYAAVWISQGSGWLETSATRQPLELTEGSVFWLFPGVTHTYTPNEVGWTEHWVLFEGKLAQNFEQAGLLSRTIPVRNAAGSVAVAELFSQIKKDFAKAGPHTAVLSGMLVGRLIAEISSLENSPSDESNTMTELVKQVMGWLGEHSGEEIDFEAVALSKGLGYSTFRRYFKQISGLPPREYLQSLRISHSKQLLVFTADNIKQIAAKVGFKDPYYFSRVFHAEVGLSPTDFRLQQQLWSPGMGLAEKHVEQ